MKTYFDQKTVLITGGGKGIGREIARLFGKNGCNVVISGRDGEALKKTAAALVEEKIQVLPVVGDVTNQKDCQELVNKTIEHFGHIDILINNAGMTMRGLFEDTNLDLFQKIMDINFGGAVTMTRLALPHIKIRKGSILFVSSIAGLRGLPSTAPYCASKMALKSFFESLRSELVGQVHFGILYVGFTENDPDKKMYNAAGELVPLKREKFNSSQADVATAALRMVRYKKRQIVMTPIGKFANIAYTFFPGISEFLISKFAKTSRIYATDDLF